MGVIRVLPHEEMEALLHSAIVGRIACGGAGLGPTSRPYLVPLAYGYDGHAIYAHSGPGRKIDLMRANPLVTFEVDEATDPDRWRSVIAEGAYEELVAEPERQAALTVVYGDTERIPALGAQTIVFRIVLTAKSGRHELPD